MYIVSLTYLAELSKIDQYLSAHRDYLERNYQKGIFIASGGKVPRTGGIILARGKSRSELENILNQDPFITEGLASYEITEFVTTKMIPEFATILNAD